MGLSAFYGKPDSDEVRFKVLDKAYELGCTNWDSADIYADSEELLGKWFKRTGHRKDIFLATKFANKYNPNGGARSLDSSPEYCKEACQSSLKKLGTDYIDLFYCHLVDGKTPIEKTVQAMLELKNEGKIKYLGLSEVSADTLRRACKVAHIAAVQVEYSPFSLDIESPHVNLLKTARQYKSPDDFETGDFRKFLPRFSEENFGKNLALVEFFKEFAAKKGCTSGQLALAWLLAQGDDIIPIPGTKKEKYLLENWGALKVELSADEVKRIRDEIEKTEVVGERYPEAMMATVLADTPAL